MNKLLILRKVLELVIPWLSLPMLRVEVDKTKQKLKKQQNTINNLLNWGVLLENTGLACFVWKPVGLLETLIRQFSC